jgi:hypothetical protein
MPFLHRVIPAFRGKQSVKDDCHIDIKKSRIIVAGTPARTINLATSATPRAAQESMTRRHQPRLGLPGGPATSCAGSGVELTWRGGSDAG